MSSYVVPDSLHGIPQILQAGVDSRAAEVMKRQSVVKLPLHWANFGFQQVRTFFVNFIYKSNKLITDF